MDELANLSWTIQQAIREAISTMVKRNRRQLRISLILILLAAFLGAWYGSTHWQLHPETWQFSGFSEDGDWIDTVADMGEAGIQLFMGLTSGGN